MKEVVREEQTPAKFYASTIQTLQEGQALDVATQQALLELLIVTIPHVAGPTLTATLPVTSRTLRSVVSACRQAAAEQETKDELGGLNAALRACCRASSQLLQNVTNSADGQEVRKFLNGTLLALWDDHRPKVRKAAQQGASEVAQTGNKVVCKALSDYCTA